MTIAEMKAFCEGKVKHYTEAWESKDPNRMFLGRKPKMNTLGHQVIDRETGKPVYNTTTAKSVAYEWAKLEGIFASLLAKKTPEIFLPKPEGATANTLIKQIQALSEADKRAIRDALK